MTTSRVTHSQSEELKMRRVPKGIVKAFKEYANNEFVGDYGLALKDILEKAIKLYPMMLDMGERLRILEERD